MIKKLILLKFILLTLFVFSKSYAQKTYNGVPLTTVYNTLRFEQELPEITLPEINNKQEVEHLNSIDTAFQEKAYAKALEVNIDIREQAIRHDVGSGYLFLLKITSTTAFDLQIFFENLYIPKGGLLFLYNADRSMALGALNHNNNSTGYFSCKPIDGNVIIVEYYEPKVAAESGRLKIMTIAHGFKPFYKEVNGMPKLNCLVCAYEAPPQYNMVREASAFLRLFHIPTGIFLRGASGALINNASEACPQEPLLLTATHVLKDIDLNMSLVIFNQDELCGFEPNVPIYRIIDLLWFDNTFCQNGVGGISGNYENADGALLQLDGMPDDACLLGWTLDEVNITETNSFHHGHIDLLSDGFSPKQYAHSSGFPTSVKRVNTGMIANIGGTEFCFAEFEIAPFDDAVFWQMNLDIGKFSSGASGASIVNQNNEIIGVLHANTVGDCIGYSDPKGYAGRFKRMYQGGMDEFLGEGLTSLPPLCFNEDNCFIDTSPIINPYYNFIEPVNNTTPRVQFNYDAVINGTAYSGKTEGDDGDAIVYWDFGDGTVSVEENPVHEYSEPGTYLVSFIIIDPETGHEYEAHTFWLEVAEMVLIARPSASIGTPIGFTAFFPFGGTDDYNYKWGLLNVEAYGLSDPYYYTNYPRCGFGGDIITDGTLYGVAWDECFPTTGIVLDTWHSLNVNTSIYSNEFFCEGGLGGVPEGGYKRNCTPTEVTPYFLRVCAFDETVPVEEYECANITDPYAFWLGPEYDDRAFCKEMYIDVREGPSQLVGNWNGNAWWNTGGYGATTSGGGWDVMGSMYLGLEGFGAHLSATYTCEDEFGPYAMLDFQDLFGPDYSTGLGGIKEVEVYNKMDKIFSPTCTDYWEYTEFSATEATEFEDARLWCINQTANPEKFVFRIMPNDYLLYYPLANADVVDLEDIEGRFVFYDTNGVQTASEMTHAEFKYVDAPNFSVLCNWACDGSQGWTIDIEWEPDFEAFNENEIYKAEFYLTILGAEYKKELFFKFHNDEVSVCNDIIPFDLTGIEVSINSDCQVVLNPEIEYYANSGSISYNYLDSEGRLDHNPNSASYIIENPEEMSGNYEVTLTVCDDELRVCQTVTETINMDNYGAFDFTFGDGVGNYMLCPDQTYDVLADVVLTNDNGATIDWSLEVVQPVGATNYFSDVPGEEGVFQSSEVGEFIYLVRGTNTLSGCEVAKYIVITVVEVESPPALVVCVGNTVALGDLITLCPVAPADLNYSWSSDAGFSSFEPNPSYTVPTTPTTIYLNLTDAAGNEYSTTQEILIHSELLPTITLGEDLSICLGENVTLNATSENAVEYWWEPADGLSAQDIAMPIASPTATTTYTVTVTGLNGCTATDDITVDYIPIEPEELKIELIPSTRFCIGEILNLPEQLFINNTLHTYEDLNVTWYTLGLVPIENPTEFLFDTERVIIAQAQHPGGCQTLTTVHDVYLEQNNGTCPIIAIDDNVSLLVTPELGWSITEEPVLFNVLTNDENLYGNDIYICDYTQPFNGTIEMSGTNFLYTPEFVVNPPLYDEITDAWLDIFTYTICTPDGQSSTATVHIELNYENEVMFYTCTAPLTPATICIDFDYFQEGTFSIDPDLTNAIMSEIVVVLNDNCVRYTPPVGPPLIDLVTIFACSDFYDIPCLEITVLVTVKDGICSTIYCTYPNEVPPPPCTPEMLEWELSNLEIVNEYCTTHFTSPVTLDLSEHINICEDFFYSEYSLIDWTTTFGCSITQIDEKKLRYTPLPEFEGINEVHVEYCHNSGSPCYTHTYYVETNFEGCPTTLPDCNYEFIEGSDQYVYGYNSVIDETVTYYHPCYAIDNGTYYFENGYTPEPEVLAICEGGSTVVELGHCLGTQFTYAWIISNPWEGWQPEDIIYDAYLVYQTTAEITPSVSQEKIYKLFIFNEAGDIYASITYFVEEQANPDFTLSSSAPICEGNDALISIDGLDIEPDSDYAYIWSVLDAETGNLMTLYSPNFPTLEVSTDFSTTYQVEVIDNITYCSDVQTITIPIIPNPIPEIEPIGPGAFCENETVILSEATGFPYGSYEWLGATSIANPSAATIEVTEPGIYYLYVRNGGECYRLASYEVLEAEVMAEINGPLEPLCLGESAVLWANDGYAFYEWTLPDGTMTTGLSLAISEIDLTDGGQYTLRVSNEQGCSSWAVFDLAVNGACEVAPPTFDDEIIVNEVSKGTYIGTSYVELLVKASDNCSKVDVRHFIVDDNNGAANEGFSMAQYGSGVADGHIRFKYIDRWKTVPSGSLILIYNNDPQNEAITLAPDPDDTNPKDKVYVVPINDSGLEMSTMTPFPSPSALDEGGSAFYSPTGYIESANWDVIHLEEGGDAMQVRNPDGTYHHGIAYGGDIMTGGPDELLLFEGSGLGKVFYFRDGDFRDRERFNAAPVWSGVLETPGLPNNMENEAFINTLSEGCKHGEGKLENLTKRIKLQAYPNPFSQSITLAYTLQESATVSLDIYNLTGSKVLTLKNREEHTAGTYQLSIKDKQLVPGMYLCTMQYESQYGHFYTEQIRLVKIGN